MQGILTQIGSKCQAPSPGRLTHLYLIPAEMFLYEQVVTSTTGVQPLLVGLKPGAPVTQIVLRSLTAGFTQVMVPTPDGVHYTVSIAAPIPTQANELFAWVMENRRRRWVAVWRDTVGNCYVSGGRDNGLRLTWGHASAEVHAHNLEITGLQLTPAILLGSIELDTILPRKEFDYSFEISFS